MRKTIILAAAAAMLPLMTSCLDDADDTTSSSTLNNVPCLISSDDASVASVVAGGDFDLHYNWTKGKLDLKVSGLKAGGADAGFTMTGAGFTVANYAEKGFREGRIINFSDKGAAISGNANVSAVKGDVSEVYRLVTTSVPGIAAIVASNPVLVMGFDVAPGYHVQTFSTDAVFTGVTTTTYPSEDVPGEESAFKSQDISYRVMMDIEKGEARVVLYDVQFAEGMPSLNAVVVEGLRLTFEGKGWKIEGDEDITSSMLMSGMLLPNQVAPFEKFEMRSVSDDMIEAKASFDVRFGGNKLYHGDFTGTYPIQKYYLKAD